LDFGLAKAFANQKESIGNAEHSPTLTIGATEVGVILGTAAYMAPEQAKGKSVDKRADIWAFGVVLYELLTGERLFRGEDVAETLAQVLTKEPAFDRVPAKARRLLRRCLEKDPRQRLRDIGEARFQLGSENDATSLQVQPVRSKRLWPAIASVLLVALVGVSAIHFREHPPDSPKPIRFQLAPANVIIGSSARPSFSPDGTKLAYYATGSDGVARLWIRSMDTLESRSLSATELNANVPIFWSYDSRFVLFPSAGRLKKIDISGGPAQPLCDVAAQVVGGSWNREGVIVFGTNNTAIQRVPSEGGNATPVTALDSTRGESAHLGPVFLPDGRHFLYLRRGRPESTGIYIGSLDLKPDQQSLKRLFASDYIPEFVPFQDGRSGEILFLREGTLLAQPFDLRRLELTGDAIPLAERVGSYLGDPLFSSSRTGALVYRSGGTGEFSTLTWFDRQGKMLSNLADAFYGPFTLAVSPDGSRAVAERLETTGVNLWLVDLARGVRTRFTYIRSGIDRYAAWSPDGAKIAFSSNRGGHEDLYLHAANGAGEDELLLKSDSDKSVTDWSRDGRFLLFNQLSGKAIRELWVLPMDAAGDQKPIPFLRSDFDSRSGRFSPNGRWVAYGSNESGGNYEIYVRPFPPSAGGGKWMVSQGNGAYPRWRRDGKELFYLRPDGELMVADVGADGAVFQAGVPRPLFKATYVQGWDMSADGTKFLFPMAGGETTQFPFTVVLNWMSLLKR